MKVFSIEQRENALWITISGPFDARLASGLEGLARTEALAAKAGAVAADLSGVTALTRAGLGFLLKLKTLVQAMGKTLFLCNPSPPVLDAISARDLAQAFTVVDGPEALDRPAAPSLLAAS